MRSTTTRRGQFLNDAPGRRRSAECSDNPPTGRQRRYLLSLLERYRTTVTEESLCCFAHTAQAIATTKGGRRR